MTQSQFAKVNLKAVIVWGIIIGFAAWLAYQNRTAIVAWLAHPTFTLDWLQNLSLDKITAFLKDYGFLITGAVAAFTFVYGIYQKRQANKALLESLTAKTVANTEVNTALSQVEQYRQKAENLQKQLDSIPDFSSSLNEAQALVTQKTRTIQDLQLQINILNDLLLKKEGKPMIQ